jgi:hypothetical protein
VGDYSKERKGIIRKRGMRREGGGGDLKRNAVGKEEWGGEPGGWGWGEVKRNEGRERRYSREDEHYSLMDKGGNEISNTSAPVFCPSTEYIPM